MRLDFRIIWIDDQQKHVDSFAEGLRNRLRDQGFELEVIRVENLEEVDVAMGAHVHNDGIDLVLVDYDLGTPKHDGGDVALVKIRKQFPYKEIVFYSATDVDRLRKIAYEAKVDGVNFSTRLSLVDDTTAVVKKLLSKVLDIDHMRGVVMSATSDIDFLVESSVRAMYERMENADRIVFRTEIVAQLKSKLDEWRKDLEKAEAKNNIEAILKLKHLFTSADRLDRLMLQLAGWAPENNIYKDKVKVYRDTVVPRRNKLAHGILGKIKGKATLTGDAQSLGLDEMTELRCTLIEHRQNFQDIAVLVDVKF